jgi:hypothetical protein
MTHNRIARVAVGPLREQTCIRSSKKAGDLLLKSIFWTQTRRSSSRVDFLKRRTLFGQPFTTNQLSKFLEDEVNKIESLETLLTDPFIVSCRSLMSYFGDTRSSGEPSNNRGRATQVSDTISSLSLASLYAELFQRMLSSGHSTRTITALTTLTNTAPRAEIWSILGGGSLGNFEHLPPSTLSLMMLSQLPGINGAVNDLQTISQLSPEEKLVLVLMMWGESALLPVLRAIPDRTMMPSIRQRLILMIQAHHVLMAAAPMNAPSRNPSNLLARHQASQPLSLEHLQLPARRHGDGLMPAQDLLQALPGLLPATLPFGSLAQGLTTLQPDSGLPTTIPIPVPLPYGRKGKTESFPGKLYRLLAEVESQGNTHIISFTPDGDAFKIHDPDAFLKQVSPKYFCQSRLTSFIRQLNFYGFDRLSHGPDRGAFAHPIFLRGHPELLCYIQRKICEPRAKKK